MFGEFVHLFNGNPNPFLSLFLWSVFVNADLCVCRGVSEFILRSILFYSHPDRRGGSEEEGHDNEEERGGGSPRGDEATSERGAVPDHLQSGGGSPQDLRCLLFRLLPLQGESSTTFPPPPQPHSILIYHLRSQNHFVVHHKYGCSGS